MKGVKHLKSKSLIGNKRTTFASSFEEHSIGKASVPKRRSGSIHIVPTRGYCHCCHELASRSINFSDIGTRPPSAKKKSIARLFDTTKNILIKEKLQTQYQTQSAGLAHPHEVLEVKSERMSQDKPAFQDYSVQAEIHEELEVSAGKSRADKSIQTRKCFDYGLQVNSVKQMHASKENVSLNSNCIKNEMIIKKRCALWQDHTEGSQMPLERTQLQFYMSKITNQQKQILEQNQIIEDLKQQARNNNEIADRNIRLTRENLRIKEELESYCHENMVLRRAFKRKYLVT